MTMRLWTIALFFVGAGISDAQTGGWRTYHGDYALTGQSPSKGEVLSPAWTFRADAPISVTPVGENQALFFYSDLYSLYAVSTAGTQLWSRALQGTNGIVGLSAPPLLAKERLILGSVLGTIVALNTATGATLWESEMLDILRGSPAADESADRLYAISPADGTLIALRISDGRRIWKGAPTARSDGSPSTLAGRIVYGNCNAALYSFSAEDGRLLSSIPLGPDGQAAGGVALSGSLAFVGTRSGIVYCADLEKRSIVWTNNAANGEVFTTPAVNARMVVFGSSDGSVCAADRLTGRPLWKVGVSGPPKSPVLSGSTVLVTAGGALQLLAADNGRELQRFALSDRLTAPAVIGNLVLIGGDNGLLSAFTFESEKKLK